MAQSQTGTVVAIFISPVAQGPMLQAQKVKALAGKGLEGDRYCEGGGSYQKGKIGNRQVTLMNSHFFPGSGFEYCDSRRNIITKDVELMYLIGREFTIGNVRMRGVKYCEPCDVPTALAKKNLSFAEAFSDRGGLIAEILTDGEIEEGSSIVPPKKNYK